MGNHNSMSAAVRAVADQLVRSEMRSETSLFVSGECMAPLLQHGAEVRIRTAPFYWPGDIVAFRDRVGRLRLHRLVAYRLIDRKLGCTTQGDRAEVHDPPVLTECILGRVVFPTSAVPNVGARLRTIATFAKIVFRRMTRKRVGDPVHA